ncbi:MAG: MATE family efflux transporter [Prevotellaceae bacterium]|jgi:putative MATE family efflux protein|nr:MATE family efflux transporter [Prevotellaceae bacterium]
MRLTSGNVAKRIFYFAWPMLLGNVFQQLYNVVDSIVVGKYIGKEALAGMVASAQVAMVVVALAIGVGIGGTVVVAQYFGARDHKRVQQASDTVMLLMIFASLALGGVGILFSDNILNLIQLPEEAHRYARPYLNVYFGGLITIFGYNAASSILRGLGDSTTPLYALIIATVVNIALDLLFVLGLGWGTEAVAMATVIAQGASWLFIVAYVRRKDRLPSFNLLRAKFSFPIFRQAVRIGLPSGFQQTFVAVGMAALFGVINTFGVDVAAGYGAATRIDMFAMLPAMNFAAALSTFTGQNLGAGKLQRVRKGLRSTLVMSGAVCIAISLLIVALRRPLIGLFTDAANEAVISVGAQYLAIVCSFYVVFSSMFVLNGLHRGAGASLVPMLTTLLSLWVVRIPVAYLLSRSERLGYLGTFWAVPIAWGIGLTLAVAYYLSGWWKGKAVVKRAGTAAKLPIGDSERSEE